MCSASQMRRDKPDSSITLSTLGRYRRGLQNQRRQTRHTTQNPGLAGRGLVVKTKLNYCFNYITSPGCIAAAEKTGAGMYLKLYSL